MFERSSRAVLGSVYYTRIRSILEQFECYSEPFQSFSVPFGRASRLVEDIVQPIPVGLAKTVPVPDPCVSSLGFVDPSGAAFSEALEHS
jgi:hypothetical protein